MDPDIVKFLTVVLGIGMLVAIPVAAYAAIVATRAIWVKGEPGKLDSASEIKDELEQLRARVAELEAVPERVTELEERVDFSERLLTRARDAEQSPEGRS